MPPVSSSLHTLARIFSWPRLVTMFWFAALGGVLLSPGWDGGILAVTVQRTIPLGLWVVCVFGVLERWPRRLPRGIARWALQVIGVGLAVPLATLLLWTVTTPAGGPPFWQTKTRLQGFTYMTMLGVLLAPWIALGALVRQKDALARSQALELELARSELERQALDARLRLVQTQVTPHFLFNTLSNVQALVDGGSPRASEVLRSLIAYLRAAVPRLDDPVTSLGDEIDLVRAYLALMQMRMPDRLRYEVRVDDDARDLRCPPLTVLTLVENAVRHGIDPREEGGDVRVDIRRRGERCFLRVEDTGVGLRANTAGLGTGLAALRERLALVFGDAAALRLDSVAPHGVRAEVDMPAWTLARS